MAQSLCQLKKKGGGKYNETILWSNSSPTSPFSSQNINLSQSIENFDYIEFDTRYSNSNSDIYRIIVPVQDFKSALSNQNKNAVGAGVRYQDGHYFRRFNYLTNTTIQITNSTQVYGTGTNTSLIIPIQIIGLKY